MNKFRPHEWLIKSLHLAKLLEDLIRAIEHLTSKWCTLLHLNKLDFLRLTKRRIARHLQFICNCKSEKNIIKLFQDIKWFSSYNKIVAP